jgi:hypothetical protein
MGYFLVLNGGNMVTNVVIADSLEVAEQITNATCFEVEHKIDAPGIGWTYKEGIFAPLVPEIITPTEPIVIPNAPKEINSPNA